MSLSTYASLSYLHESSSNPKLTYTLQLHNKEKKKPKLQMKTSLNPNSALASHFQRKDRIFIGKTHTFRIPGRSGEQTLPLTPQQSRRNAAWAAFPRPGCGQMATPCWWVYLGYPSAFIFSGFFVWVQDSDEMALDSWL